VIERAFAAFDYVQAVIFVLRQVVEQVVSESRKIACNRGNTTRHTFQWRIPPGFIIAGEYSKIASSYKLVVFHREQRAGGIDEVGVIDNLNFIIRMIKHIPALQELVYLIMLFVDQLVCKYIGILFAFPRLNNTSVAEFPIVVDKVTQVWQAMIFAYRTLKKQALTYLSLDSHACLPYFFHDGTRLQNFGPDMCKIAARYEEHNNRHVSILCLEPLVQPIQRLQGKIKTLVFEFIPS